jgi:hypothetical protein
MKHSRIIKYFAPEPTGPGVRLALGLGSIYVDELKEYTATHPALGYAHFIHLYERGDVYEPSDLISHVVSMDIQEDLFTNQPFFEDKAPFQIVRMQTTLGWTEFHELYKDRKRKYANRQI